jgi:hypothetical protein
MDTAWFLPFPEAGMLATANVSTVAACAALCKADCQFFTYDYVKQTCMQKQYTAPVVEG